ncbi:MAG: CHAD domain-containing protein [Gammaproteobacteria bacterium]
MTNLPGNLLNLPIKAAARLIALAHVEEVRQTRQRLDDPKDHEALHDFRVSLRRLRSCLRAYKPYLKKSLSKTMRRQLRELAAATRTSRDLEVQLAWLHKQYSRLGARQRIGARNLIQQLEDRKALADRELHRYIMAIFNPLKTKLSQRLSIYTATVSLHQASPEPTYTQVTAERILELGQASQRHFAKIHSITNQQEAHQARIAGKRLRYLLEPAAETLEGGAMLIEQLKSLQDLLGDMHDAQTLIKELAVAKQQWSGESQEIHGLTALVNRLSKLTQQAFTKLKADWLDEHGKDFFTKLHDIAKHWMSPPRASRPKIS